jgi:hypothetical protein
MQNALLFTLLLLAKLFGKSYIEIWGQSNKKEICGFNKVQERYLL